MLFSGVGGDSLAWSQEGGRERGKRGKREAMPGVLEGAVQVPAGGNCSGCCG